ncbi:MAG: glycogen synthase GlgA [Candidatus Brocadiia bacterium]
MHIIQITPEMVPFAKTGGLADVTGALPKQFASMGHKVSVFMPLYKQVKDNTRNLVSTDVSVSVKIGDETRSGIIWKYQASDSQASHKGKVDVYFIQRDEYYHRDNLYSTPEGDYWDNAERFIFFSRATLEAIKALNLKPDVIHCHDWQSALVPIYTRTLYKKDFGSVKTVITVHNLAYQGSFWHWDMKLTGLDWSLFNWKQLEFWGKLNFLKGGLVFSDIITTVSPRYAQEIQTHEFGCGLEGVLKERSKHLFGIINGIDYGDWNPDTDRLIPDRYAPDKLQGKAKNKVALQRGGQMLERDVPIIGMVTRLADQKGLDMVSEVFDDLMKMNIQFVLLGTGDEKYHKKFSELGRKYQVKTSMHITFDNSLAHLIIAGSDMLLVPSRYEPCGLSQLYALKYGTVPIVRETGGLADTIINYAPDKIKTANGFSFKNYSSQMMLGIIKNAVQVYNDKKVWKQLMSNGMSQDWSWGHSANEYLGLYKNRLPKD